MPSFNAPAVSVIIPVRNSGRYFRECLDSVTRQTLQDIEIIIIDDASTDGSDAVAEAYAAQDSRITVIHHNESTGAGPARNDGMAIAKGEYIAFMDSDDLYPTADVLEKLYCTAVEKKANICGGSLYKIDADGNILDMKVPDQYFEKEGWVKYREYQYDGGFYRFLYRRYFLLTNGIDFPSRRRLEDPIFFIKAMLFAEKFYAINNKTYLYRKNHKQSTWPRECIIDHLSGIIDILDISYKYNLKRLHYLMAKNSLNICHNHLNYLSVKEHFFYIYTICSKINWHIVYAENKKNRVKITLLKIILTFISRLIMSHHNKKGE